MVLDAAYWDIPTQRGVFIGTFAILVCFLSLNIGEFDMQDDLNTRRPIGDRRNGIGGGTIAAIVAAVLIVGALFMWGPWNGSHSGTASNSSTGTTTGSSSTTGSAAPATTPAGGTTNR